MHDRRQRPDREGRREQPVDAEEDLPRRPDRRGERPADDQPGRVRRRRSAHAEGDLHPRRQALPRHHPLVGEEAADGRAGVRQLDRRWRLRPRDERLHRDGQGAGQGLPRRSAAGQDGHRRGVRRRVARRCRDARPHLRPGRLPRRRRARRDPDRAADRGPAQLAQGGAGPDRVRRAGPRPRRPARPHPHRPQGAVRPARGDRPDLRRRRPRATGWSSTSSSRSTAPRWSPAGPGCTAGRSASSPTRRACCSPRRPRRRRSSSSWPTRSTYPCCSCTTPPATWSARSTSRAASSSTAPR